ncbi:hypothetical protein AB0H76_05605 [Nocardia sp. NPDC050712]|uniref:hypothetical protein n=1 Tax=Nocardia sp. NPDC050712 TaxID=3155518 RepID=UPI0033D22C6D
MRGMRGALALAVAAGLSTGCTHWMPGTPTPEPAARAEVTIDDYGLDLALRERADLRTAAVLRTIDPCGLVSRTELGKYGRVVQVVPHGGPHRCQVLVLSGAGDSQRLLIELGDRKPDAPADYAVDGGVVLRAPNARGTDCALVVPMKLPAAGIGGLGGETFTTYTSVTAHAFDGDNCLPAATVAAKVLAAAEHLKLPLRGYAANRLPGGGNDPCALAGHLPAGWRVGRFITLSAPYDCTFYAKAADNKDHYFTIRLEIGKADVTSSLADPIDLGGRPGTLYCPPHTSPEVPENCFADFALDGTLDGNVADSPLRGLELSYGKVRTVVSVYGIRAVVQEFATAATALYR